MGKMYLSKIMSGLYCKIVFFIAFVLSYFLLPSFVWEGVYKYIAIVFMFTFSLSVSCTVKSIKEKVIVTRSYKTSIVNLVLSLLGFSAFQVCGISAGFCTASLGTGIVSAIFPSFFLSFLADYGHLVIWASVLLQVFTLYFMKCFRR